MPLLRTLYNRLLSNESRYWLYKQRHRKEFERLKTRVNHHPKGDFSLKGFSERKAIFVHITKSAGTSVALSLFGALPYHYTASQYRVIFGRNDFNRFFKFTFVRNPWDRLYSAYSYLKNGGWDDNDRRWSDENLGHITSFEQFVMEWLTVERLESHKHFWPQSWFIKDAKGNILVDYVGYFETIDADFRLISERVNPQAKLAHTNASKRGSYRDIYGADTTRRVAELYHEDIESLGYDFDRFDRRQVKSRRLVPHGEG